MAKTIANSNRVNFGQPILPVKRVEIFPADEWETFIEEWLDVKKIEYITVERFGGSGDKGRDVIAKIKDPITDDFSWDCYQ